MRIVYFDIDTLRPDHLGTYGYHRDTSPGIDEFARRGARFESCYVSEAPCLPSRTALFSGRFGIHNGVVGHGGAAAHMRYPGDGHVTDPEALPLPMVLSRAGYKTATFTTFAQHTWRSTSMPGVMRSISTPIRTASRSPKTSMMPCSPGCSNMLPRTTSSYTSTSGIPTPLTEPRCPSVTRLSMSRASTG